MLQSTGPGASSSAMFNRTYNLLWQKQLRDMVNLLCSNFDPGSAERSTHKRRSAGRRVQRSG
jgi:hypothetical protein